MRCTDCGFMYYCSKKCQINDWRYCHKYECKLVKKLVDADSKLLTDDQGMKCFRYCIKTHFDKDVLNKKWKLFDGSERKIDDMVDHVKEMREQTPERFFAMVSLAEQITTLNIGLDLKTVLRRCGQVKMNSFAIIDELSHDSNFVIASGMFIESSIFNHSCRPNAVRVFNGSTIEIRASREIDTAVEGVTLTYIDCQTSRDERKNELRDFYYFDCQCEFCATETEWELDHRLLPKLSHQLMSAHILRDPYLTAAIFGDIKRMIRKWFGDYHILLVHLLRNQLEILISQPEFKLGCPSRHFKELLAEFETQASVIYGFDHPYTQHCLTKFS